MRGISATARRGAQLPSSYVAAFSSFSGIGGGDAGAGAGVVRRSSGSRCALPAAPFLTRTARIPSPRPLPLDAAAVIRRPPPPMPTHPSQRSLASVAIADRHCPTARRRGRPRAGRRQGLRRCPFGLWSGATEPRRLHLRAAMLNPFCWRWSRRAAVSATASGQRPREESFHPAPRAEAGCCAFFICSQQAAEAIDAGRCEARDGAPGRRRRSRWWA
jgi:hypothetical protein